MTSRVGMQNIGGMSCLYHSDVTPSRKPIISFIFPSCYKSHLYLDLEEPEHIQIILFQSIRKLRNASEMIPTFEFNLVNTIQKPVSIKKLL